MPNESKTPAGSWIETEVFSGLAFSPSDGGPVPTDIRRPALLPQGTAQILSQVLRRQDMTVTILNKDLQGVIAANLHPAFRALDMLWMPEAGAPPPPITSAVFAGIKRRVMETGKPESVEGRLTVPDGTVFFGRFEYDPFRFEDGSIGVMCRFIDLTQPSRITENDSELKAMLDVRLTELEQKEHLLDFLLKNNVGLYYFIQDENLKTTWIHSVFTQPGVDPIGKDDAEMGYPQPSAAQSMLLKRQVIESGSSYQAEQWWQFPDGTRRFLKFGMYPLQMANGKTGVACIAVDQTRDRMAQDSLQATLDQVVKSNEKQAALIRRMEVEMQDLEQKNGELARQREENKQLNLAMLPKDNHVPALYDLAAYQNMCARTSGDHYDYLALGEEGVSIIVGSPTQYGLESGIMAATLRSYFRMLGEKTEPAALLGLISDEISGITLERMYLGLTACRLEGNKARLAMGGMPPVFVYRAASDELEVIGMLSMLLGTMVGATFPEQVLNLEEGDMVIIFTRGFTECLNAQGEMPPLEGLKVAALKGAPKGSRQVVRQMKKLLLGWTEGDNVRQQHDATVVAVQYMDKRRQLKGEFSQETLD